MRKIDANGNSVGLVELTGSNIPEAQAIPYQIVKRKQTTIQTHNAVSVGASSSSIGSWIDCGGFDKLGATLFNDAATSSGLVLQWSNDGVTFHGYESLISTSTLKEKIAETSVKARYVRLQVWNDDTVPHTMSAWAYLKC